MNKVRQFMPSALKHSALHNVITSSRSLMEMSLILAGFIICSFFAIEMNSNHSKLRGHFLDTASLYKVHISEHTPFIATPLTKNKSKGVQDKIRINVEDLISTSMNYSYAETQFGFYLKDVKFLSKASKGAVEKKIISRLPRTLAERAKKYLRAVLILSEKHQVDPIWVLSVMWTESHFDPAANSHAGARGLMQLMPKTKSYLYHTLVKRGVDLSVEEEQFNINNFFPYRVTEKNFKYHTAKLINIELGIIYLKQLLNYFEDHRYATIAYNMGPTWTSERLRNNLPVGVENKYLAKVEQAYRILARKI